MHEVAISYISYVRRTVCKFFRLLVGVNEQFNKTRACAVSLEKLGCKVSIFISFLLYPFRKEGLSIGELSYCSIFGCFRVLILKLNGEKRF